MTRRSLHPAALLLVAAVAVGAAPAAPDDGAPPADPAPTGAVEYQFDPDASLLYVQVFADPDTLGAGFGHDHVVAATGWSGTVTWDPSAPETCAADVTVPVAGLRPDDPALRQKVGYTTTLDARKREGVRDDMLSEEQLDAERFGEIRFRATSCEPLGHDTARVQGELTIHGVTVRIAPVVTLTSDGRTLRATSTFSARATDFGFEPYSAMMGALKNLDEMKFTLDVRADAR